MMLLANFANLSKEDEKGYSANRFTVGPDKKLPPDRDNA